MMLVFFLTVICFNPRICKRCDYRVSVKRVSTDVSIHASVKDATFFHGKLYFKKLFQSTHL